jgi:outer membrane protein insertion porin family
MAIELKSLPWWFGTSKRPGVARARPDGNSRTLAVAIVLLAIFGPASSVRGQVDLPPKAKEPFVGRIFIDGNASFSDDDLKRQMMTSESPFFAIFTRPRLDRDTLRRDIAALEAFYHANGFLEAKVTLERTELVENGTFVNIYIRVDEGEPTRVALVNFEGAGPVRRDQLAKEIRLKPGVPFNPSLVDPDVYAMKRLYFDKGYVAVEIADSVAIKGKSVSLIYRITPGPIVTIRRIEISGNKMTKDQVIERELALKVGEPFRLSKAIETQRNLFETGLFTEAEILPVNLDKDRRTVDVAVRVRERKSAYVEFGFGVGNILGSRVTGEWGEKNLFGRGNKLVLSVEYSFGLFEGGVVDFSNINPEVKYYRYDASFGQRHILGTRILFALDAYLEKDATVNPIVIWTRGVGASGLRHLSPRTDVLLRLLSERIEREAPEVERQESNSRILSGMVSHNTRDFILDPRRGSYRDLRVDLAGGILGGDNDFYSLSTALQKYWTKRKSSVVALRTRIGFADAYGSSKDTGVPIENRFFTGGGNSVRGFKENSLGPTALTPNSSGDLVETPIGGRVLLVCNAELRFPLPLLSRYRFSAAVFADAGNVWPSLESVKIEDFRLHAKPDEVTETDFRYSAGVGLRYNTPIGPIRLDYGMPIKKNPSDRFGRFHLSLGQIF